MRILLLILKLVLAIGCLVAAGTVRMPSLLPLRGWLLFAVLGAALVLVAASLRWRNWSAGRWIDRGDIAPFTVALGALCLALTLEGRFQLARWTVRHAEPAALNELGRHLIVGYADPDFVRDLVKRQAIAGIFVTQRNVANRDVSAVAGEIAELQAIRASQGLPPLFVATDQEGGGVSRLSPPLPPQPTLASIIAHAETRDARRAAVLAHADRQGRELASLGINLNFAPVVDLNFGIRNPKDAYTRIADRAIAADPDMVSEVAGWYCDGLAAQHVLCTAKHFPGLGRVFDDTHLSEGQLNASADGLNHTDWLPFRTLLGHSSQAVMIGHVRLRALDAVHPASTSKPIVNGLLRHQWGYDGIVVTDDMSMGPIYFGDGGMEGASLRALNAGVDLLLLSWDGELVYPVLAALLKDRDALDAAMLQRSDVRLRALQERLPAAQRSRP